MWTRSRKKGSGGGGETGTGVSLIVSCDSSFAGATITCSNGINTYTAVCSDESPYQAVFVGVPEGTWTISGIFNGDIVYITKTILSNTADLSFASLIPIMTSNTTPSGIAGATSILSANHDAYKAFNGNVGTAADANRWVSARNVTGSNAILSYHFSKEVLCKSVTIHAVIDSGAEHALASVLHIEAKKDNEWVEVLTANMSAEDMSSEKTYNISNNEYCTDFRIFFDDFNIYGSSNDYYTQCRKLQFNGFMQNS